jgi:primosomal replication protein N
VRRPGDRCSGDGAQRHGGNRSAAVNVVRLQARLVSRADLRYTPAGIAVLEAGLSYDGTVAEAGAERHLRFEVPALAVGSAAQRLGSSRLGAELLATGFLAPRSQRSRSLIFHITEFENVSVEH